MLEMGPCCSSQDELRRAQRGGDRPRAARCQGGEGDRLGQGQLPPREAAGGAGSRRRAVGREPPRLPRRVLADHAPHQKQAFGPYLPLGAVVVTLRVEVFPGCHANTLQSLGAAHVHLKWHDGTPRPLSAAQVQFWTDCVGLFLKCCRRFLLLLPPPPAQSALLLPLVTTVTAGAVIMGSPRRWGADAFKAQRTSVHCIVRTLLETLWEEDS